MSKREKLEKGWVFFASGCYEAIQRVKANKTACAALKAIARFLAILAIIIAYTACVCAWQAKKDEIKYEKEFEAFRVSMVNRAARDAEAQMQDPYIVQLNAEADAIARAIGPMETKRMKQTMAWNILTRVDSEAYPNTVEEVVDQPKQWMFYSESNPIRDDDKALALEILEVWHDGRYPAGLSAEFVYGEWSSHDYVLRDTWIKDSNTNYWRMPE